MRRQYEACANPGASKKRAPYLVNVQSDLFDSSTVVVAPSIAPYYFGDQVSRLNPALAVDGENYIVSALEITAVLKRQLGDRLFDLAHCRDEIVAALDMVFTGS